MESECYRYINFNRVFNLKSSFHCQSMDLIYVIIGTYCFEEYIGETCGELEDRRHIYRQHIREPDYQQLEAEEHL